MGNGSLEIEDIQTKQPKLTNYDRWLLIEEKIVEVFDAAIAVGAVNGGGSDRYPFKRDERDRLIDSMRPGWSTEEKSKRDAWERCVDRDTRRAVKLLYADYCQVRDELAKLLTET